MNNETTTIVRDFGRIPQDLKDRPQWAPFKTEWDEKKKKYAKRPMGAKSNDSTTWKPFAEVEPRQRNNNVEIAYCLAENEAEESQLIVIDLDEVIKNGGCMDSAQHLLQMFEGTYIEGSVSGDGIHIFLKGKALKGFCNALIPEIEPD